MDAELGKFFQLLTLMSPQKRDDLLLFLLFKVMSKK